MERAISALGILVLIAIAYAFSRNRKAINWRVVAGSLALQFGLALLLLKTEPGEKFFTFFGHLVDGLMKYSEAGSKFVFGDALNSPVGPVGFVFFVKVLSSIVFFSSLVNVFYYLGVMQFVVAQISKVMRLLLRTSGAETLCASGNIFIGQSEAPLLIRPFLVGLTESELMVVMVSGFATMAAGVMFLYAGMLDDFLFSAPGHILTASVLSAPAAIMMAKIVLPETGVPVTSGDVKMELPKTESNVIEAAANGAATGLHLGLMVMAMLIAFISLVALINGLLGVLSKGSLTLELIFGTLFSPMAWLIGTPSTDVSQVGTMLGKGLVVNEFVAYMDLNAAMKAGSISPRAAVLTIYALCGFTNLSSVAIQIGGIGSLAESRKSDLARLGFLALFAACLANLQTAALAGILVADDEKIKPPAITAPAAVSATPQPVVGATATPAPPDPLTSTPSPTATP